LWVEEYLAMKRLAAIIGLALCAFMLPSKSEAYVRFGIGIGGWGWGGWGGYYRPYYAPYYSYYRPYRYYRPYYGYYGYPGYRPYWGHGRRVARRWGRRW
jgi:hypothetical protein